MSRSAAYDFVRLGRFLERADMTTRILDVRSADLLPRIVLPAAPEQAQKSSKTESRQAQSQVQTLAQSQVQGTASGQEEQTPFDSIQWMSVLKSLSAYQMYRQQVRLRVGGSDVVKFLLQDPSFPRAVSFCLQELEFCLRKLPKNAASLAAVNALKQRLNSAEIPELAHEGLHEFIDEFQIGLGALHDLIAATYFMA